MKKVLALLCIVVLCGSLLLYSFWDRPEKPAVPTAAEEVPTAPQKPVVYFLNGQPVLQLIWDQLTEEFYERTGMQVKTVSSEANLAGNAPVLFSVSTPEELEKWNCLDLKDTVAYANLTSGDFSLRDGSKVLAIAGEAEPLGLIYNTELLAQAGYTGGDIDSFSDLQAVAQLISQSQKDFGAFCAPDEAGRYADLLAAVPEDIRLFWDLYRTNQAQGSLAEGAAVFQLGTLTDMQRLSASGTLQLEMLPLYTGGPEEEQRGLHCFGKHYWCVREDAGEEEIATALAFLNFLISPREDGTVPVDDLALLAPYRQAVYAHEPVGQRLRSDIALGKALTICGAEVPAPAGYAEALQVYAQDPTDENWAKVAQK